MANKFGIDSAASIGALLAAPIAALQEAQIEAEKQVLEFILQYGLKESEQPYYTPPELALFTFQMRHALPDPANPGSVAVKPAEVAVPLLSLMHLPAMRISDVKIDLAVEIDETASEEQSAQRGEATRAVAGGGAAPMGNAISGPTTVAERLDALRSARNVNPLMGRLSSRSSRNAHRKAKMNISLTIKGVDDDEIYQRLMRLIGDSMTALVSPNGDGGAPPSLRPTPDPGPSPGPAPLPSKPEPLPQDPPPTFPEPPVEISEI